MASKNLSPTGKHVYPLDRIGTRLEIGDTECNSQDFQQPPAHKTGSTSNHLDNKPILHMNSTNFNHKLLPKMDNGWFHLMLDFSNQKVLTRSKPRELKKYRLGSCYIVYIIWTISNVMIRIV